jgi:peptide/bleomycin uptake transporter
VVRAFFGSRQWFVYAYGGAVLLLVSLYLQVRMTVAINEWYGGFYNLLQTALSFKGDPQSGTTLFYDKIISLSYVRSSFEGDPSFIVIAVPYVLLAMGTAYFTRRYGLWWREAITFDYIPRWRKVAEEIEGASQRIQEDTNRFARIVESLGLQAARAVMTLIAFLPLLWYLSQFIEAPFIVGTTISFIDTQGIIDLNQVDGVRYARTPEGIVVTNTDYVPGILVWIALISSVGGMAVSWLVGAKLPGLEYNNQVREAAFRKELVYGEDDKVNFASVPTLTELFDGVRWNYKRLYLHYGYFDLWAQMYDQCMIVVPYLVVGPSLFTGAVLLGVMVQVSNAFQKVHGSFSLFINNWTTITELRSIWRRLREFESNLDRYASERPLFRKRRYSRLS